MSGIHDEVGKCPSRLMVPEARQTQLLYRVSAGCWYSLQADPK